MRDDPISRLARLLARLPGVGKKSGARMAYHLWKAPGRQALELARTIEEVAKTVNACPQCGAPDTQPPCRICSDPGRDRSVILAVEEPADLDAIEEAGVYHGLYHVLDGALSPVAGVGPEDIRIPQLIERACQESVKEIVLGLNPSVEGDATTAYLEEELSAARQDLVVTRLGRGMPVGSEIKYLDPGSLGHAIKSRRQT